MKKKKRLYDHLLVVLLAMQMFLLAACSQAEPEGESGAAVEETAPVEGADVSVPEDMDTGAALPEDNRPDGEYEIEESLLTQQEAETLIDPLVQWAGLYMIGRAEQRDALDDTLKMQIAGITAAYGYLPEISSEITMADEVYGIEYAAPEGYIYVGPETLRAAENLLFGEAINDIPMAYYQEEIGKVCLNDGDGGMFVLAGDWGLEVPRGEIVSIENMGGILNMVTVSYVLYDCEEEMVVEELGWIEYLVQGTEESGDTPKIINMNIQVLYVNEEAYLYENWKDDAVTWESDAYSIELPKTWEERVHSYQENGTSHFICSAAASENYMGVLFSIAYFPKGEAVEAPDYQFLGEDAAGVYIAFFPSDVQFDPDDGYAAREYVDLSNYVEEILSTFHVK